MSWREVEFTANRQMIHDLLLRARRFHAPINFTLELDVTELRARMKAIRKGRQWGLVSYLVRATAMVVRKHPSLQRHLFTSWTGRKREIVFDHISCTLIVARKAPSGEDLLLPLLIRDVDRRTLEEIDGVISEHRDKPIEQLEQFKALERVRHAPRIALRWFSYKARSDPAFYSKFFGTYGLSALIDPGGAPSAAASYANTAIAFLPGTLKKRPWIHGGAIVPREILNMVVILDHNLIDGIESQKIMESIREVFEAPDRVLGPADGGESS